MTANDIHQPRKVLQRSSRIVAALIALAVIGPVVLYAYGYSLASLELYFSFSAVDLLMKVVLGIAMLILVFFARPRSAYLRIIIGTFGGVVLGYASYGAFSETMTLGDSLIYFVGCLITLSETVEAEVPRRRELPATVLHRTPSFKA